MTMPHLDEVIRSRVEALTVVWLVLTASIGVYAMVVAFATFDVLARQVSPVLAYLLRGMACALVALSILLPRRLVSDGAVASHMRSAPDLSALAMRKRTREVDLEELRRLSALPELEQRLVGLFALAARAAIIGLALSEAVALLGLVFGLLAQNLFAGLPMLAAAFGVNLCHYPRPAPLLARGRKFQDAEEFDALQQDLKRIEQELHRKSVRELPGPGAKRRKQTP